MGKDSVWTARQSMYLMKHPPFSVLKTTRRSSLGRIESREESSGRWHLTLTTAKQSRGITCLADLGTTLCEWPVVILHDPLCNSSHSSVEVADGLLCSCCK